MATTKESVKVLKVKDSKIEWGMLFLNFIAACTLAIGTIVVNQLISIDAKVGSIDTTTQLNQQHIVTIFKNNEKHENDDKLRFAAINAENKAQDRTLSLMQSAIERIKP